MIARGTILRIAASFTIFCMTAHTFYASAQQEKITPDQSVDEIEDDTVNETDQQEKPRIINKIIISGNKQVSAHAIATHIPYQVGEAFDPNKTRTLINNIYADLKRFRNIKIFGEDIGNDKINLHVVVEEKTPIKEIKYEGNSNLTLKEINEKTALADLPAADEQELKKFAIQIKKLYVDKGYIDATVTPSMKMDAEGKAADVLFTIKENKKAVVKRVKFVGNKALTSKKIRNSIFTREDWVLSFLDKAGTYQPDRMDADRHMIEQLYQNNGYLQAKVVKTDIDMDQNTKETTVIYHIEEGPKYHIKEVKVACENELISEAYLLARIPIHPGDIYSRESIVNTIKGLEFLWGDLGYLHASVEPSVQPDDEEHTINLTFYIDTGLPITLNKLTIRGNKKTRDKIIRRKIGLAEGELITNSGMEWSKNRIESLGYFEQRDGVNWKITRLSDDKADLDMIVKETKTGSLHLKFGLGGAGMQSPTGSASMEAGVSDTNLFGKGLMLNASGRMSATEKTAAFSLVQPWLFDRPIYSGLELYHKRLNYDQLHLTPPVIESNTGGSYTLGFVSGYNHYLLNETFFRGRFGIDNLHYGYENIEGNVCQRTPRASIPSLCDDPTRIVQAEATNAYNRILTGLFEPATYPSLGLQIGQDKKNHPVHTSNGYAWLFQSSCAIPTMSSNVGFHKLDLDFTWFTPLIGDFDLIFKWHSYLGIISPFKARNVPYRELFHIGGPATVRGYLYGQIGPQFAVTNFNGDLIQDSIGGTKAFFINTELIFPITSDFSMKGLFFYDGGAGWDNPYVCRSPEKFILNNTFNYKHTVGVGLRLMQPAPISIDWGFKLDPAPGETSNEVHFGMTYGW